MSMGFTTFYSSMVSRWSKHVKKPVLFKKSSVIMAYHRKLMILKTSRLLNVSSAVRIITTELDI